MSLSPLTAVPSPGEEGPVGTGDPVRAGASLTDSEHRGFAASISIDGRGSGTQKDKPEHDDQGSPSGDQRQVDLHGSAAVQQVVPPPNDPAEAGVDAGQRAGISDGMEHFQRLRRRLLASTLLASSAAVPLCWLLFDRPAALSLLVGAVAGLLYLVLLARSVARLGGERRSISKVQLLVPVVLVLASSRIPQLELVPALLGFLLYKPALLIQAFLDR